MAVRKNADGSVTVGILPEEKAATAKEAADSPKEAPKKRARKPKQE